MAEESSILELLIRLRDEISEPLESLHRRMEGFEQSLRDVAYAAATAFVGFEALEHLIGPAAEFEEVQTRLAIASQATAEQLEELHKQADELSVVLPRSAEEITKAQTALVQSFGSVDKAMEATKLAVRFGVAANMEAAEAAKLLGAVYQSMGDKTKPFEEGLQEIADKMTLLMTRYAGGTAGGSMLARSFARIAEAAQSFGVSATAAMAVLGELNRLGLGGARGAGQYVQQILTELGKLDKGADKHLAAFRQYLVHTSTGGINLIKTLEQLKGASPDVLRKFIEETGTTGQAIKLLIEHLEEVKQAYGEFEHATGAAGSAAIALGDNQTAAFAEMQEAIRHVAVTLGTEMLPTWKAVEGSIKAAAIAVNEFLEAHSVITKMIGEALFLGAAFIFVGGSILTVAAALKSIGLLFMLLTGKAGILRTAVLLAGTGFRLMGTLAVAAFGLIGDAMTAIAALAVANPFAATIIAVAALSVLAYELYENWDGVAEWWDGIMHSLSTPPEITAGWDAWEQQFTSRMERVREAFRESWVDGMGRAIREFNPITLSSDIFDAWLAYMRALPFVEVGAKWISDLTSAWVGQEFTAMRQAVTDLMAWMGLRDLGAVGKQWIDDLVRPFKEGWEAFATWFRAAVAALFPGGMTLPGLLGIPPGMLGTPQPALAGPRAPPGPLQGADEWLRHLFFAPPPPQLGPELVPAPVPPAAPLYRPPAPAPEPPAPQITVPGPGSGLYASPPSIVVAPQAPLVVPAAPFSPAAAPAATPTVVVNPPAPQVTIPGPAPGLYASPPEPGATDSGYRPPPGERGPQTETEFDRRVRELMKPSTGEGQRRPLTEQKLEQTVDAPVTLTFNPTVTITVNEAAPGTGIDAAKDSFVQALRQHAETMLEQWRQEVSDKRRIAERTRFYEPAAGYIG